MLPTVKTVPEFCNESFSVLWKLFRHQKAPAVTIITAHKETTSVVYDTPPDTAFGDGCLFVYSVYIDNFFQKIKYACCVSKVGINASRKIRSHTIFTYCLLIYGVE